MNRATAFCQLAVVVLSCFRSASAQQPEVSPAESVETQLRRLDTEVENLHKEVSGLRSEIKELTGSAAGLFLFGIVCALWAQNSGRNPWLWFFLGLFFSIITGLVLLSKNSQDRKMVLNGNYRQSAETTTYVQ